MNRTFRSVAALGVLAAVSSAPKVALAAANLDRSSCDNGDGKLYAGLLTGAACGATMGFGYASIYRTRADSAKTLTHK